MVDFANRSKRVRGDVAERLKALDSKSSIGETLSEVRILPSPQWLKKTERSFLLCHCVEMGGFEGRKAVYNDPALRFVVAEPGSRALGKLAALRQVT